MTEKCSVSVFHCAGILYAVIFILVVGYDAMGYEMSKPHLRAELEADLREYVLYFRL